MKPFILLAGSFGVAAAVSHLITGEWHPVFAGNLAMCLMLVLTALGHVLFTRGMAMMIPPFIPWKTALVYATGLAEIILGLALMVPLTRSLGGYTLIALFILLLPANIYAAIKRLDLEKAAFTGPGPGYLWFRVPEQLVFIGWVWYFSVQPFVGVKI